MKLRGLNLGHHSKLVNIENFNYLKMKELRERFLAGLRQSILIVTLFFTGFAHGTTWYVNKTGSNSYNGTLPAFGGGVNGPKLTISAALAIASDGDTLVIGKGVYSERVEVIKSLYIHTDSVVVSKFIVNGINKVTHVYGDTLEILDSLGLLDGVLVSKSPSYFLFCPNICRVGGGSAKSYVGVSGLSIPSPMPPASFLNRRFIPMV